MILEKHSRVPRKLNRNASRTKSERGHAGGLPIPHERKEAILEDAKEQIFAGLTIDQIAAKHGISHSTLELWLSSMGDEYRKLREAWLDGMLVEAGKLLKDADDALGLARGRELWKRATWYAERRDRARYGEEKGQLNVAITPILHITVADGETHVPQVIENKDIAA